MGSRDTGFSSRGRLVQAADGNFYGTSAGGGVRSGGTAYRIAPDGNLTVIHTFNINFNNEGYSPSPLTIGADGNLYAINQRNGGSFFKMNLAGEVTPLSYPFQSFANMQVHAALLQAPDGSFYGTSFGVANSAQFLGSIFRLAPNGTVLFNTALTTASGTRPEASLVAGENGNFYGTTSKGGNNGLGTIFQVAPDGGVTPLFSFAGANGSEPKTALVKAADGNYYGTTARGGTNSLGTVYRFVPGTGVTTLVSFDGTNGSFPNGGLTPGADGNLYGTTNLGGTSGNGTFYRINLQGQLTVLASFNPTVGSVPANGVTLGSDGRFYGSTLTDGSYGAGTIFRSTPGGTISPLVSLGETEGFAPITGVTETSDGNFYGSAALGGSDAAGSIFKITPVGTVSTLASLIEADTGRVPTRVVQAPDGNLYGATLFRNFATEGTVFKVTLQGQLTVIAPLTAELGLGASDLLLGTDGNCYGLTMEGGSNNAGTIFRLTPEGVLSTFASLHVGPSAGGYFRFTRDSDGSFYGTASATSAQPSGVAFKVTPAGVDTIFPFSGFNLGTAPSGGLTKGTDGNFYGTASGGGEFGKGTVFKMTSQGSLARVASFNDPNAGSPLSSLVLAEDGTFYGTTFGPANVSPGGTVFNVTPAGALATSAVFGETGGSRARGPLIKANDGYFYGTTEGGGIGGGVVLRFTSSPPELNGAFPSGGLPGDPIVLSGKFLAGTSEVKFNGVTASFKINDSMHITALVPNGAISGPIEITNPLGSAMIASFASPPMDSDADGMPDEYEQQYFGSPTGGDPAGDSDGDGETNLEEYRARTNPLDARSVFRISQTRREGNDFVIVFPAVAYKGYRVDASANLADGFPIILGTTAVSDSDGNREVIDFGGALQPRRFYRAVIVP